MGLVGKNAVQDALDKWDGIVRKPGSQIEEKVPGCDRVFLDEFSAASVRAETLAKFSVPNYNARLTGGYSIVRTFRGGISEWAPRLDAFAKGKVAKERAEYKRNARRSIAINIFQDLANMEGTSRNGNKGNIGTVTASKLAFFLCPEMPFFIYDSVVGAFLGRKSAPKPNEYQDWCDELELLLPKRNEFLELVTRERISEFSTRMDWLARRSLDLALYAAGKR